MLIEKEHFGLYSLRALDRSLIGQVLNTPKGWMFRDNRGFGPRRPEVSAARALKMAIVTGHLKISDRITWEALIAQADAKFHHNQRVAAHAGTVRT